MASIVRYAIGIASSLENAGRMVAELLASKLKMESIAIIGEQRSFTSDQDVAGFGSLSACACDDAGTPSRIMSLGCVASEVLPSWARRNAMALRHSLDRWLAPAHSRRLSLAVGEGALLVWVELKSAADEQAVTRCLLRCSQASVAIHDFFLP
ncbi:MAG: hypothetical protein AB7F76_05985 [Parvibaculaceae bacterium]